MFAAPIDSPLSPPPADAIADRPGADRSAAGQSFGDHLKRAQGHENESSKTDNRGREKASGVEQDSDPAPGQTVVQLVGSAISDDGNAVNADTNANKLIHTCLTTDGEPDGEGEKETPITEEGLAVAGEVIAQAAPHGMLQVSTNGEDAAADAAEKGEQPVVSKLHRSEQAANPTSMPANKAAAKVVDEHGLPPQKEQIAGTLETHAQDALSAAVAATPAAEPQPATPDALPADGAAQANAPNQSLPPIPHPASSSVAASTADLADQLPTPKEVKEPSHVQEPEAPEQERPRRDAPRQSDAIKSDASAATNLAATYTSVTLVAPGALPQSTSVATVSAIPSHGDALERKGVATLSGSGEPALTPGQHPDGPSSDALQTPAVRELAEPTRHVRESNGTSQNEMGRTNLGEADRVRFVQRVARAMHSAVDRGGEVRLRLSPPELGRLTLDVVVRDGVMSARLEAETQTARSLLVDNLPALRDRLAEQNLRIDRFEVNLRDGTSGSLPDHTPNQSGQHSQPHAPTPNRPKGALPGGVWTTSQPIVRHIQTNDQLNVVV